MNNGISCFPRIGREVRKPPHRTEPYQFRTVLTSCRSIVDAPHLKLEFSSFVSLFSVCKSNYGGPRTNLARGRGVSSAARPRTPTVRRQTISIQEGAVVRPPPSTVGSSPQRGLKGHLKPTPVVGLLVVCRRSRSVTHRSPLVESRKATRYGRGVLSQPVRSIEV